VYLDLLGVDAGFDEDEVLRGRPVDRRLDRLDVAVTGL